MGVSFCGLQSTMVHIWDTMVRLKDDQILYFCYGFMFTGTVSLNVSVGFSCVHSCLLVYLVCVGAIFVETFLIFIWKGIEYGLAPYILYLPEQNFFSKSKGRWKLSRYLGICLVSTVCLPNKKEILNSSLLYTKTVPSRKIHVRTPVDSSESRWIVQAQ